MTFEQPRGLIRLLLALAAAHWLLPLASAAGPTPASLPAGVTAVTQVEGITEYRLDNGLQVLLAPDASKPTTTVNVVYRVGSRHESYGETGMAHLLEHMVFKGTPTTRNVWAEFTKRGLRANGSTSPDRTNYFASFAANAENLRWYLGWQADIMVNSFIARSDLDTEMTVVRNEFEMGENNPSQVLFQNLLAGMYQWHNYGKPTIGARSDIENVDIGRLQAFYRRYYQPDNATLVIAGQFDAAQVLEWVVGGFGAIARPQRTLPSIYTEEPVQNGPRLLTVRRVGGTPLIYVGYHVVAGAHPDFAALTLLDSVLGDTPNGRLHRRLVEPGLATGTFASTLAMAEPGVMILGAGLPPGQDTAAVRTALASVVDGLRSEPVTEAELERARRSWLNAWDQGFADPERVGVALSEAIAQGDWRLYFLMRDRIRAVQLADVQRVAQTYLLADNHTVAVYEPTDKPQRAPALQRVDVAEQFRDFKGGAQAVAVASFDSSPANLDARTRIDRIGGLAVGLLSKDTRGQTVSARLRLRFGDVDSLKGLGTAADFTAALIDKGGAGMTRQEIADAFVRLQAEVGIGQFDQVLSVSLRTRGDHLPELIALIGRLLREPAFEASALEELRRQQLAAIEQQRHEPEAVIADLLARHGNPYPPGDLRRAMGFDEVVQSVRAVHLSDLADFHRRFYSAASGEFAAVGQFDAAAVRQALQQAFGDWQQPAGGPMPFARVPRPLVPVPPARIVAPTPDKANAHALGQLSLPLTDGDPDALALTVANQIFGLGGNSRLWMRIREKEGLSYDVGTMLGVHPIDANSTWRFSAIFAPQNQPKVETAFQQELARSLADGFTEAELTEAKQSLLNRRRLGRAQDAAVSGQLALDLYLGRRFEREQRIDTAIAALTLPQINAAWRRYIRPEQLVMAWGGDFKAP